jgi:hypothetical protein
LRKKKALVISSNAGRRGRPRRAVARRILAGITGGLPAAKSRKLPGKNPNLHLNCTREEPPPPSARLNRRRRRERPWGGAANARLYCSTGEQEGIRSGAPVCRKIDPPFFHQ